MYLHRRGRPRRQRSRRRCSSRTRRRWPGRRRLLAGAERPVLSPDPTCTPPTRSPRCGKPPRRCRCRCSPTGWAGAACHRSTRCAFAKARRAALAEADVVAVVGTPLDFRLNFGDFGDARVIHIVDAPQRRATHVSPVASPAGDLRLILTALADHRRPGSGRVGGRRSGRRSRPRRRSTSRRWPPTPTRSAPPGSTASCGKCSTATRWPSATGVTSSRTPVATCDPASPRQLVRPRPVRLSRQRPGATRSRPGSPTRTGRSVCCWATVRPDSR